MKTRWIADHPLAIMLGAACACLTLGGLLGVDDWLSIGAAVWCLIGGVVMQAAVDRGYDGET